MSDWDMMFRGVQQATRPASFVEEGIGQIIAYAHSNKREYGEADYWQHLDKLETDYPTHQVTEWAEEGLTALPDSEGWELLLLDLGDAPDTFHLYRVTYFSTSQNNLQWVGHDGSFNQNKLRHLLSTNSVIEFGMLDDCFDEDPMEDGQSQASSDIETLSSHNVGELDSEIFSWNKRGALNWHGSSGELAWLAFGSLALIEPLRDPEFCRRVLGSRSRLYLLSGSDEIFFHLATVTRDGLTFDV